MAEDAQVEALQASIEQASDAQRKQNAAGFRKLQAVLDYAALVVTRTRPILITDQAVQLLTAPLGQIATNPQNAALEPASYAASIIDALTRFPASLGRELEQDVRQDVTKFRRSASAHLRAVRNEAQSLKADLAQARVDTEAAATKAVSEIEAAQAAYEARLAQIEAAATTAATQVEQQATTQEEEFTRDEARRDEDIRTEWKTLSTVLRDEGAALVAEIQEMRDQTKALVGTIGTAGTANHFEREANRERTASWVAFFLTCLALGGAVFIAASAARADTIETKHLIAKIAAALALTGLATFTASRAHDHREREKQARDRELDLKAFGPFIAPLPEPQQIEERILMTRRSFARNGTSPPAAAGALNDARAADDDA
jgi:hypothetical protein